MQQPQIIKICVCGAGTMGSGIAQVTAQKGFDTVLYDLDANRLGHAKDSIYQKLRQLVTKNKISPEEEETALKHLLFTGKIDECTADLIIEAIVEEYEAKRALLHLLGRINGPETFYASNTSSLSVSEMAKGFAYPQRLAGMHFFNPAPVMKLVEVIRGLETSDDTIHAIFQVAYKMDKTPVLCKDAPGFIVNHVARPYYIESLRLVEEHLSDYPTIDVLLESTGFKLGPFKLMDLIGNDINFTVSCSVYEQLGKPVRLKPSILQKEKVEHGALGIKTGKGYYKY